MKKERVFQSRPGRRFMVMASIGSGAALFMVFSAVEHMSRTYGTLRSLNSIPIFIAGTIFFFLLRTAFDCTGRRITVTPLVIRFQGGKILREIPWKELRELKVLKNRLFFVPLSTTLFVGDGKSSFQVQDIAFPEFSLIVRVIHAAVEQARASGYDLVEPG